MRWELSSCPHFTLLTCPTSRGMGVTKPSWGILLLPWAGTWQGPNSRTFSSVAPRATLLCLQGIRGQQQVVSLSQAVPLSVRANQAARAVWGHGQDCPGCPWAAQVSLG